MSGLNAIESRIQFHCWLDIITTTPENFQYCLLSTPSPPLYCAEGNMVTYCLTLHSSSLYISLFRAFLLSGEVCQITTMLGSGLAKRICKNVCRVDLP